MQAPPARTAPAVPQPRFPIAKGVTRKSWKTGIYGPEGIGKSSLAALCPGVVFADLEHSTEDHDVARVHGIEVLDKDRNTDFAKSWSNLRLWIQSLSSGVYCIDSMTRAEDWCASWVIQNKKIDSGKASSIEDFKYRNGLTFIIEEFRCLLGDIDCAFLRGASFIMIAHDRINKISNPDGSDFVRHEPRLIHDPNTKSMNGKGSNMDQWVAFVDHLLFIDLDKNVDKGKVQGSGSRTIYLDTSPSRVSKTRSLPPDPMAFDKGETSLWGLLGVK